MRGLVVGVACTVPDRAATRASRSPPGAPPASHSKGDPYVGYEEERVEKFDPSKETKAGSGVFGEHVQTLKTYKLPEEFPEEIGEIHGIGVDAEGNFYLYQAENIVKFNNA